MICIKLTYAIKDKKQNEEPKWFKRDIEVFDVTGDFGILIIRVYDKDRQLKGIWVEYRNARWKCLQEDVDVRMIEILMENPKVVKHLNKIEFKRD